MAAPAAIGLISIASPAVANRAVLKLKEVAKSISSFSLESFKLAKFWRFLNSKE
jgi:hypothetical protein